MPAFNPINVAKANLAEALTVAPSGKKDLGGTLLSTANDSLVLVDKDNGTGVSVDSVILGKYTGNNNTTRSSLLGYASGFNCNVTDSVLLGYRTGQNMITCDSSILIGKGVGFNAAAKTNHIEISTGKGVYIIADGVSCYTSEPIRPPSVPVANLPSPIVGSMTYAQNGRKAGEAAGAGTGCPVYADGTTWRTFYSNAPVAA